jgi:hypothetical protein
MNGLNAEVFQESFRDLQQLTGFTPEDGKVLATHQDTLRQWVKEMVTMFYDTLFGYANTAKVFHEGERPAREQTLSQWLEKVFSGKVDEAFWEHQWLVGLVHVWRKIPNSQMLGMMSMLQQFILQKCLQAFSGEEAMKVFLAFKRISDVAAGLIAESYLDTHFIALERFGLTRPLAQNAVAGEANKLLMQERKTA